MKLAIMQPYFGPYIGYFSLINEVDMFVLYDTAQYTKGSWINRNRVHLASRTEFLTVPIEKHPLSTPINEVRINQPEYSKTRNRYLDKFKQEYGGKALCSQSDVINTFLPQEITTISRLNEQSIAMVCRNLEIHTPLVTASELALDLDGNASEKVIQICRRLGCTTYVNPIGGRTLYHEDDFNKVGIELEFFEPDIERLESNLRRGQSGLSILSLLLANPSSDITSAILRS